MRTIYGTAKDDAWTVVNPGTFVIDGLGGIDTLNLGTSLRSNYTITLSADGAVHVDTISGASGGEFHATLYNFEKLVFGNNTDKVDLATFVFPIPAGLTLVGSNLDEQLNGTIGHDSISGMAGNDTISGAAGNDKIDGGLGYDTAVFSGKLATYNLSRVDTQYTIQAKTGVDGIDTLANIEALRFADMSVNLTIQDKVKSTANSDVQKLIELYVAFFNRIPDANGLEYWIDQVRAGKKIDQIAESFYSAGILYSELSGFSTDMSNADFINIIYRNSLGRKSGADPEGLAYWTAQLESQNTTRGMLVATILNAAHTFKGDPTWGWVADLLDNKLAVSKTVAIDWGISYNSAEESISKGMAIALAITPTDTSVALGLVGVSAVDLNLV